MSDFSDLIADYDFALPPELIAQRPSETRDHARLLLVRMNPEKGLPRLEDLRVRDLPQVIAENPELAKLEWVRNRSRVFPARFYVRRPTGGRHEIVLLERVSGSPHLWKSLIRGQSDFRYPQKLFTDCEDKLEIESTEAGIVNLKGLGENPLNYLWRRGEMPLPPYIKERLRTEDFERYQALWANPEKSNSAAAPTASLHFSEELLAKLSHLSWLDTYLHVGLGTFEPLRSDRLSTSEIHPERIEVPSPTLLKLQQRRKENPTGKFCVSVGTTAFRCLESLNASNPLAPSSWIDEAQISPLGLEGKTRAFVKPGFEVHWTRALWTNFHLPQSTLLVLVSTFCDSRSLALEAYKHATSKKYRFFSYGDASFWI